MLSSKNSSCVWARTILALSVLPLTGCKKQTEQASQEAAVAATQAAAVQDAGPLDHDEEPPPPPPTGRPVVAFSEGKEKKMVEPEALEKGLTVVDLSNYWVPYIFSERDSDTEERKPNEFRPVFRKLANDWHYESRTKAAAREIVERQIARTRRNRIWRMREDGVAEEEIRKIMGLPASGEETAGTAEGAAAEDDGDAPAAGPTEAEESEERFEGGLGEAENFLEVYGIPPSLSVLRKRAVEEIDRPCFQEIDYDLIRSYEGFKSYRSNRTARDDSRKGRRLRRRLDSEMEKLGVSSIEALREHPKNKLSPGFIEQALEYSALREAQALLACEGLFDKGEEQDYWAGGLDWKTHRALLRFEHKNRIFGWGFFGKDTLDALGRTPKERLFDSFVRVLQERLVDATRIIEDGSAVGPDGKPATFKDTDGTIKPVPNLVAEHTAAALHHMDLKTPDKVVAFLKSHDDDDLDRLFAALPLPPSPPYYSDDMSLKAVIDRGDVWYDYPYTEEGEHRTFPRQQMPTTTLYAVWNGQEIPLATMNTTIGGWRTEVAPDGYEYFRYKNSDVGPRVWRDIVAGPVWLPPSTTPGKDLLKNVRYRGRRLTVPNYDEFGPWYASAYGLVAGFHVRPVERKDGVAYYDNGIRSHGSVDYNSILRRYSHGCHRLYNHLAIRLFSFVLRHTPFERVGQISAGYSREVVVESDEEGAEPERYIIRLDSKGYKYELKTPVPITVLPGNIRGRQKTPIESYMPKPGATYGEDAQFLPDWYWAKLRAMDGGVAPPKNTGTAGTSTAAPSAPAAPATGTAAPPM